MSRKIKAVLRLTVAGFGLLTLAGIGGCQYASTAPAEPVTSVMVTDVSCPSEDSCTIDYRDGHWIIRKVTP